MIRILIADDHPIVCGGLAQLIASTTDMEVASIVSTPQEVLSMCRQADVDVLLLDLSMPGVHGLSLLQEVLEQDGCVPVVVLSMHNEGQIVQRAMKMGASAYVTKESDPSYLLAAIRKVMTGSKYIDPSLMDSLAASFSQNYRELYEFLSERELQVLRLIVAGNPISDIAVQLHLSPKTVSTHKMRIMQKLDISNNADLVRYAMRHGIG